MKKLKLFMAAFALILGWSNAMAQKDVTSSYITNATLSDGTNGWTKTHTKTVVTNDPADAFSNSVRGNNTVGYASEAYAGWGSLIQTAYSMKQTITLPAGNYRLVCYAFFRQGAAYNTNASKSLAKLVAGSKKVDIKTLGSITAAGYANSQAEGANCFDSKMYRNTLDFTIDADNTAIEIGVEGTFDEAKSWCIVGQFELIDNDQAATMDSPFDVTGYLTNPGFEYRDMTGWTLDPTSSFGTQNNEQSWKVGGWFAEKWQASGNLDNRSMSQTLTDLPAGYYKLTANLGGSGTYVSLNGKTANWTSDKDYTVGYVLAEDEDLTITAGKNGGNTNWIHFDNFRLYFCGDVAAALTSLLNTAKDILDDDPDMNSSVKSALQTAYDTYNQEYSDVDELLAAIAAMQEAVDAAQSSISVYGNINTAISTYASDAAALDAAGQAAYDASGVQTKYNNGTYVTLSEAETELEAALVIAVKSQTTAGSDMTRAVPNAAGTAAVGSDNWKIKETLADGEYFRLDTWAGTASGMAVPMIEYWITNGNTLSTNKISQTITGLQNGIYTVTATTAVNNESNTAPTASSALLFANDETKDITSGGTETTFKGQTGTFSVSVEITDADNGELELGLKTVSPNYNWIAFKDVTLTYYGAVAEEADYTALASAITAAEAKTLGFEDDEYAPYNNVDALEALAAAKAIDPDATNPKAVVNNATTALTGATWTANDGTVECVYNGNFAEGQGSPAANIQQYGWTRTNGWGQFKNDGYGSTTAYYNQPGSLQYGNAGVYTMPLKATTVYRLQFKYAKWDGDFAPTVSVLNAGSGMAAQTFGNATSNYKDGYNSVDMLFVTAAAGNYILSLSASTNYVITGVSIAKAASQVLEFADGSVPRYAPGTYPSVKITRTLTAGRWATAVYPFAISTTDVDEIAVLARYNSEAAIIGFDNADNSTANVPFLMRSTTNKSEISLSNVAVSAASVTNAVAESATLVGSYANNTAVAEDAGNYILSENTIYPVGENVKVNAYRAYINIGGINPARALRFVVGEITGVDNVEAATEATLKDGKYLENGKIAIYKNGMKFSATGAKLK